MSSEQSNKYRIAIEVLQRGRDVLVEDLANEILDRQEDLAEGGFLLNEFLEAQGTRIHLMCLIVAQLEQSAEALEEARPSPAPTRASTTKSKPAAQKRPRAKKLTQPTSGKGSGDEL